MLARIDSNYDSLVISITTRADLMTLTHLYTYMLSYEVRKEQQHNGLQIGNSIANNVMCTGGHGGRSSSRGQA